MDFANNKFLIGDGNKPTLNYQRKYKSPLFNFNVGAVSASGTYLLDYHRLNTATEKYGSFNNLRIFNSSTSNIIVYPNQDRNSGIPIASGTSESIAQGAVGGTTSLLIEEISGSAISANQIRVQIWKDLTELENVASNLHDKFLNDEPNWKNKISDFLNTSKKGAI